MNVKELKEHLADLPDDYIVELNCLIDFIYDNEEGEDGKPYEVQLHKPIDGISWNNKNKEVLFVLTHDKKELEASSEYKLGNYIPIGTKEKG